MSTQYPSSPSGVWPPPPTNTPDEGRSRILALLTQYRSPVALTRWMIGFVAFTVLLNVFMVVVLLGNPKRTSEAQDLMDISNLPRVIAGILFYVWTYRLYKNRVSLGVPGLKSTPGIAVLMCMLPIVNLYQPVLILWRDLASVGAASKYYAGRRALESNPFRSHHCMLVDCLSPL